MTSPNLLEQLEVYARLLLRDAQNASAQAQFMALLTQIDDFDALLQTVSTLSPIAEVVVPIYERMLQLRPEELAIILQIGSVYWINGDDERAENILAKAKAIAPDDVEVMRLEALLARDEATKRRLYAKILMKAPNDRDAWQNLLSMGR